MSTSTPAARDVRLGVLALAIALTWGLGAPTAEARSSHPHHDDGGAVAWFQTPENAKLAARNRDSIILVDISQPRCDACQLFMTKVLTDPAIKARVGKLAVGLHINGRRGRGDRRIKHQFRTHLAERSFLPWIGFLHADGRWISGFAPERVTNAEALKRDFLAALQKAEKAHTPKEGARPEPDTPPVGTTPQPEETQPKPPEPVTPPVRTEPEQPRPPVHTATGLQTFHDFASAQRAARSGDKMIFVIATKPNCPGCDTLKDVVVPRIRTQMARHAVVLILDATRLGPDKGTYAKLHRNLPGAYIMPLAGFLSKDGRFLSGFFGKKNSGEVLAAMGTARRRR